MFIFCLVTSEFQESVLWCQSFILGHSCLLLLQIFHQLYSFLLLLVLKLYLRKIFTVFRCIVFFNYFYLQISVWIYFQAYWVFLQSCWVYWWAHQRESSFALFYFCCSGGFFVFFFNAIFSECLVSLVDSSLLSAYIIHLVVYFSILYYIKHSYFKFLIW